MDHKLFKAATDAAHAGEVRATGLEHVARFLVVVAIVAGIVLALFAWPDTDEWGPGLSIIAVFGAASVVLGLLVGALSLLALATIAGNSSRALALQVALHEESE